MYWLAGLAFFQGRLHMTALSGFGCSHSQRSDGTDIVGMWAIETLKTGNDYES